MIEYQYYQLSNGIRLIHKQLENTIVAHCGLFINAGSRDEKETEHGIAHFIEHVIFKGTKKRKAYHILSRLENVGGELNAYTTKEETCIYASFLSHHFSRVLELFADVSLNSVFPDKELKKEKEVVVDEINSYKDNPSELIFDEFEELLFYGHSLGKGILGTPSSVRSFSRIDLLRFIKRNYHTEGMVISTAGSLPFKKVIQFAEHYFGHLPASTKNDTRQKFTNYAPRKHTAIKETYQTHTILGNIAYDRRDKKRNGLYLLTNVLGGPGMNSRLNMLLREKYGFTYHVESNYQPYSDSGHFSIYLGTDTISVEKSIALVFRELKLLREKKLGTLQLQRAKQQMTGQIAISFESSLNEMLSAGKSLLYRNTVDTLPEIYEKIERCTADELREIANEIFIQDQFTMLSYKSVRDEH